MVSDSAGVTPLHFAFYFGFVKQISKTRPFSKSKQRLTVILYHQQHQQHRVVVAAVGNSNQQTSNSNTLKEWEPSEE